jgi:hypothetical protein
VTLSADGSNTVAQAVTDLNVTGRPAQFGRGLIKDVSDKLLGQFVEALSGRLAEDSGPAAKPDATEAETTTGPSAGPAAGAAGAPSANPYYYDDEPAAEPIDLLGTAGGPLVQRLIPIAAVAGVALLIFVVVRRRRRRRALES